MKTPRLLILGFGPFPDAPDNPATHVIERLRADQWTPAGSQTGHAVLPTVWAEAPEAALWQARTVEADAILLVGVANAATGFRVETGASNRADSTKLDAKGQVWPGARIDPQGPERLNATVAPEPLRDIIAARGLPAALSNDAGDYLCNFTFYRLLAEAAPIRVAFLHIPPIGPRMRLETIVTAVQAAAWALAEQLA